MEGNKNNCEICGRNAYEQNRCIFHLERKDKDPELFQEKLNEIFEEKSLERYDFTDFVFPDGAEFPDEIKKDVSFLNAVFQGVVFFPAAFKAQSDFTGTIFRGATDFSSIIFENVTIFDEAEFYDWVDFSGSIFRGIVRFDHATFKESVTFESTLFDDDVTFHRSVFVKSAHFDRATFKGKADFSIAIFYDYASFQSTVLQKDVGFKGASFESHAGFENCTCKSQADFSLATFKKATRFDQAVFEDEVNFKFSIFEDFLFIDEELNHKLFSQKEVDFRRVQFLKPERVFFRKVDLSRFRFLETDLREVNFIDVDWYRDPRKSKRRGVNQIHEEVSADPETNKFDYPLIAQVYKRLRANYEENLNYAEAGDFHIGEMNMRKKGEKNVINKTILYLYEFLFRYGESFRRPAFFICFLIFVFPLFFMLAGIAPSEKISGNRIQESINYDWDFCLKEFKLSSEMWEDYKTCLLYSISSMSLVREKPYYPSYFSGYVLTILEYIFMAAFISFFILALRRRFRR